MWYIMGADKGSQLISGFSKKVNQNVYLDHLNNKKLPEILNFETVEKGDVFYMPSGRVHALGPGVMLAEIQQTSDTTYRIYDWDRTDEQGNSRELHTQEALEAIDFEVQKDYKTHYDQINNATASIISSPYFTTNIIDLDVAQSLKKDYTELDSFVLYICVEGSTDIFYGDNERLALDLGEAMLIPAIMEEIMIVALKNTKILEVYVQ